MHRLKRRMDRHHNVEPTVIIQHHGTGNLRTKCTQVLEGRESTMHFQNGLHVDLLYLLQASSSSYLDRCSSSVSHPRYIDTKRSLDQLLRQLLYYILQSQPPVRSISE